MAVSIDECDDRIICEQLYLLWGNTTCVHCGKTTSVGALAGDRSNAFCSRIFLFTRIWLLTARTMRAIKEYGVALGIGKGQGHDQQYYANTCTACEKFIDDGVLPAGDNAFGALRVDHQSIQAGQLHRNFPGEVYGEFTTLEVGTLIEEGLTRFMTKALASLVRVSDPKPSDSAA